MQCWLVPRQKMGSTRSSPHARPSIAGASLPKRYSTTLLLRKYSATFSPEAYDKRASAHIPPLVETVARCLNAPPPPYRSAPADRPRPLRETTERCRNWAADPPYQSTSTSSQGVSARSAQPCTRRWRCPLVGWRPRFPGGWNPGGWSRATSHRTRETMTPCGVTQAKASDTAANPPSTTKTRRRHGSQRRTCCRLCRAQAMLVLCRRRVAVAAGQHHVVSKGRAHTRGLQGIGPKSILATHLKLTPWITGVVVERTAAR
jgi:hypothetical protein